MAHQIQQSISSAAWALVSRQHGVITRGQLLGLGYTADAIKHRIWTGRLHPIHAGVYAVGRPELTRGGSFMAAVLACGPSAALSHQSAAELWRIRRQQPGPIQVSTTGADRRHAGIRVHRRKLAPHELTTCHGIAVTTPVVTLIDIAASLPQGELEAAIRQADKLDLAHPDDIRGELDHSPRRPGIGRLRRTLDRHTFVLTDSELERWFLPIARRAGLPPPLTQQWLNGYRVDFFWPDLELVVETDGLRHHRTALQQATDNVRDHAHFSAGYTPLRFTHWQIRHEPRYVERILATAATRLRAAAASSPEPQPAARSGSASAPPRARR